MRPWIQFSLPLQGYIVLVHIYILLFYDVVKLFLYRRDPVLEMFRSRMDDFHMQTNFLIHQCFCRWVTIRCVLIWCSSRPTGEYFLCSSLPFFMSALLKVSSKCSTCPFDCGWKGGVLVCWVSLGAQKFENVPEANEVALSVRFRNDWKSFSSLELFNLQWYDSSENFLAIYCKY